MLMQSFLELLHLSHLCRIFLLIDLLWCICRLPVIGLTCLFACFLHIFQAEVDIEISFLLPEAVINKIHEIWGLKGGRDHGGTASRLITRPLLAGMLVQVGVIVMLEETFRAQIFFIEVTITLVWLSVEFVLFCYIEVIQIILSLFQHLSYGIITEILYLGNL